MESFWTRTVLPVVVSLSLHGGLLALLLFGIAPQREIRPVATPKFVQAKLVTLEATAPAQPEQDKPKIVDLTEKRREQERRQQEQERLAQEQARKQAEEAARREAEAAARRKAEQEARQKAEQEARQKAEEEKARQEAEAARQAEAEARRQEQERREAEQRERFEQALAQEQQALADAENAAVAQSYMGAISARIEANWSRPPSARNNMECELAIQLVPTGRVVSVEVVRSSGNAQFDRSAVQAVERVELFPEIREMSPEVFEQYYRELRLIFRPQDLRQ